MDSEVLSELGYSDGVAGHDMNDDHAAEESYRDGYDFGADEYFDQRMERLTELANTDPTFDNESDFAWDGLLFNVSTWGIDEVINSLEMNA